MHKALLACVFVVTGVGVVVGAAAVVLMVLVVARGVVAKGDPSKEQS